MDAIPRESVEAVADPHYVSCGSCPVEGFQQPLRLCGRPSQLLAALEGASVGDEIVCSVSPSFLYRNGRTGQPALNGILFQIWRIVEIRSQPGESIMEFVTWARIKSRRQRRKVWQVRRR